MHVWTPCTSRSRQVFCATSSAEELTSHCGLGPKNSYQNSFGCWRLDPLPGRPSLPTTGIQDLNRPSVAPFSFHDRLSHGGSWPGRVLMFLRLRLPWPYLERRSPTEMRSEVCGERLCVCNMYNSFVDIAHSLVYIYIYTCIYRYALTDA